MLCLLLESNKWSFLPDSLDSDESKCTCLGLIGWYVLTAPRKQGVLLMLHGGSCSRMVEMHFFLGFSLVGIYQYPSHSVSLIAYVHLRGLMAKPFASRQDRTLSSRTWCSFHVFPKTPMLSRFALMLLSPCKTCSGIYCAKPGAHWPMGNCLYLYLLNGIIITHSFWGSSSSAKV